MHGIAVDRLDIVILEKLQQDSRIPKLELANAVNLSPSQCFRRLKRLEESGLIARYGITLDKRLAGYDVLASMMIRWNKSEEGAREKLIGLIQETDSVIECYAITGEYDFLLTICCTNMRDFNQLISVTFMKSYVSGMHSYMLLECLKKKALLPQITLTPPSS